VRDFRRAQGRRAGGLRARGRLILHHDAFAGDDARLEVGVSEESSAGEGAREVFAVVHPHAALAGAESLEVHAQRRGARRAHRQPLHGNA